MNESGNQEGGTRVLTKVVAVIDNTEKGRQEANRKWVWLGADRQIRNRNQKISKMHCVQEDDRDMGTGERQQGAVESGFTTPLDFEVCETEAGLYLDLGSGAGYGDLGATNTMRWPECAVE